MKNNYCENCGTEITEDMKFCKACGTVVNISPQEEVTPIITKNELPPQPQVIPPPQAQFTQPQQPNPVFQTNNYNTTDNRLKPLGVGDYILAFIILAIPIIGFIVLLVWAFGSKINKNRQNFARAILIMSIISTVLAFIITILLWSAIVKIFGQMSF